MCIPKKGATQPIVKIWYTLFERLTHKGVLRDFLYEFCFLLKCTKKKGVSQNARKQ